MKQVSLSKLLTKQILLAMLAGLLISLPLTFIPAYFIAQSSIEEKLQDLQTKSYEEVDTHLATGWHPQNINKILLHLGEEIPKATFYLQKHALFLDQDERPNPVNSEQIEHLIAEVNQTKQAVMQTDLLNATLFAAYPIKFKDSCLPCHAQAVKDGAIYPGLLAGTIAFQAPFSLSMVETMSQVLFFSLFIIIFILTALYLTHRFIQLKLFIPLQRLSNRIVSLKLDAHTQQVDWQRTKQDVIEIDQIDKKISHHIQFIQGIYSKLDALIVTEHETGLFHRERFNEVMQYELMRSKRYQHPFSVVIVKLINAKPLDLATFQSFAEKEQNAMKVHTFSQLLMQDVRATDLVFRVTEDIFVIIAPETGSEGIVTAQEHLTERLKTNVGQDLEGNTCRFEFDFKMGHACFDEDGLNAKQLMHEAAVRMNASQF